MTDSRPLVAKTQLRRSVQATDTTIPVLSTGSFNPGSKKILGEERIECESFGFDEFNQPVMLNCRRGLDQIEAGASEARYWPGGTEVSELGWTTVEILDYIPTDDQLTEAMEGRQFMYRDALGNLYTFNVVAKQDDTRYVEWINEPPETDQEKSWQFRWVEEKNTSPAQSVAALAVAADGSYFASNTALPTSKITGWSAADVLLWTINTATNDHTKHIAVNSTSLFATMGNVTTGLFYVMKYNKATGAAGSPASFGSGVFGTIPGIAADETHVYISDYTFNKLLKYTVGGVAVSSVDLPTNSAPSAVVLRDGVVYVELRRPKGVQKYNAVDLSDAGFIPLVEGNATGQVGLTEGIEVDSFGRLWIADASNNRINVYDASGLFLASIGSLGSDTGQFKSPRQLALDANDRVWVGDTFNLRAVILTIQEADLIVLGFEAYTLQDEFIGGGNTSGAIGELGWLFNGNGTYAAQASTLTHPGIGRLSTGASSGNANRLSLGPWTWNQIEKMDFIWAPDASAAATNLIQRAGFMEQSSAAQITPANGVCVEFDPDVSNNFLVRVYGASALVDSETTIMTAVAGAFYLCRFERVDTSDCQVTIIRLSDKTSYTVLVSGVPLSGMEAVFAGRTKNGVTKLMDVEYWSGRFSGLTRE